MAVNYGITYCKWVINTLDKLEDKMFKERGHGFDKFSQEGQTHIQYTRLLRKFENEKANGYPPSYDPSIHGSFNE